MIPTIKDGEGHIHPIMYVLCHTESEESLRFALASLQAMVSTCIPLTIMGDGKVSEKVVHEIYPQCQVLTCAWHMIYRNIAFRYGLST